MTWLGRLVVILWLSMMALIGTSKLYGRETLQPNTTALMRLGICYGRPCFMGIAPGITKHSDTERIMAAHAKAKVYGTSSVVVSNYLVDALQGFGNVTVMLHFSGVDFINPENLATAGSFIDRFGEPCGVTRSGSPYGFTLSYPYMHVGLGQQEDRITRQTSVVMLQVFDPPNTFESPGNLCMSDGYDYVVVPWLGFTSIDQYKAHGYK